MMVSFINTAEPYSGPTDALGALLEAAQAIEPPTAESVGLFLQATARLGENAVSREAAAQFFLAHSSEVLELNRTANGTLTVDAQGQLSTFFAHTLFTEPIVPSSAALRQSVLDTLSNMLAEINEVGDDTPVPPVTVKELARLMGGLVGALEGGFQLALDELKEENEAVDGMVDLLFSAKGLLPLSALPGVGKLLVDMTLGEVKDWVKGALHKKAEDANDAIPFHELLGPLIEHPDLATDYDAARADAFLNRTLGLN